MLSSTQTLGLYVSVPFCRVKCTFCNFASGVGSAEAIGHYVDLLCTEVRSARAAAAGLEVELPEVVDTVYLGGGTPSLLQPEQLNAIFAAIRDEWRVAKSAEITLEAAPGQIGDALLQAALSLGVNRVSLGVQSFVDREAQAVGRSHTEASCRAELQRLRAAGLMNVGADLIAGLPYQTEASWERSLAIAAGFAGEGSLQHLSVYMLEVDEDSRLGREVLGGGARLHAPAVPSDDLVANLYEQACARLPQARFQQYEISNFAQAGYRSKHNLKYWRREPYLGLGLDAHSMLLSTDGGARRWANPDALENYNGHTGIGRSNALSVREAFEETVFLGLRLQEGLATDRLAEFPSAWTEEFLTTASSLAHEGLLELNGDGWSLTTRGRLLSSEIFAELLCGVAA